MKRRFPNPTPYETIYDLAKITQTGDKNRKDDEKRENIVKIKKNKKIKMSKNLQIKMTKIKIIMKIIIIMKLMQRLNFY